MPLLFTVQLLLCYENASHLHSHPSLCVLIHSIFFHHLKLHPQFGAQCLDSSNPNTGNSIPIWSYTTLRVTLKTQFFLFYRLQSFAVTAVWDELAWNNRHINQQEETQYTEWFCNFILAAGVKSLFQHHTQTLLYTLEAATPSHTGVKRGFFSGSLWFK